MLYQKIFQRLILLSAILAFIVSSSLYSQNKAISLKNQGKTVTIQGEVIGLNCYLREGAKATGEKHKECAISCAKAGGLLAILTKDGEIYVPVVSAGTNPDTQLMDYVADQVVVTGNVVERGNDKGIEISSIKKIE
jgi:hypothetical protein